MGVLGARAWRWLTRGVTLSRCGKSRHNDRRNPRRSFQFSNLLMRSWIGRVQVSTSLSSSRAPSLHPIFSGSSESFPKSTSAPVQTPTHMFGVRKYFSGSSIVLYPPDRRNSHTRSEGRGHLWMGGVMVVMIWVGWDVSIRCCGEFFFPSVFGIGFG